MDAALKSPGSDAVIIGPENESSARPGTANTMAQDDKTTKNSSIMPKKEDAPKVESTIKPKKAPPVVSRLNQYAMYDKNHPLNKPFPAIQNFKGPKHERKTTDILCILVPIFVAALFGFHIVLCHLKGWPTLLTKPLDFRAKMCGVDKLKNRPYLYYLTPSIDLNVAMCVEECPPTTGSPISIYETDGVTLTAFNYTRLQCDRIGKYCYPAEPSPRKTIDNRLSDIVVLFRSVIGELFLTIDVMALALLVINFICFGVLFGLRKKVTIKMVVWGLITLTVVTLEIFGFFTYQKYKEIVSLRCLFGENRHNCGGLTSNIYFWMSIVFWSLGGLYLSFMAFYFNEINLVIGIMGAALKVTGKSSEIKSAPVVSGALISGICMLLIWVLVEAASIGQVRKINAKNIDGKKVKVFQYDNFHLNLVPIDFFLAYYLMLAILGFIESITSYAICIWFFSKQKDTTRLELKRCYNDTMKYHLGSVSFLTIIKLIFKPVRMITRPLYESLASSNQKNFLVRFLQVACMPCIWLHHKLIRYLSKNCVIMLNMWSSNFSSSSKQSYYLVKGNEQLIEFVLRQMKLSISLIGAMIFYVYSAYIPYSPSIKNISDVANPFIGSVFTFCFGIFVTSAYTGPYDMIIRSIVHCHFMDEEMFVGDQRFSAAHSGELTQQADDDEEKKSQSLFAELMGYWKKGADDDNLNAAAKELKKKEMVKEELDLDDLYKKVPDGEEEDDQGPSSEEDNGPGNDMFTENKKGKLNKEQDFDEDFLKKPKAPESLTILSKPLAKPKNTEFEVEAEMDSSMERREKGDKKDLNNIMAQKSDESFEVDQAKPVVMFTTIETEKKDQPKPILKNSTRFIEDDNKSMKSSISKKRKVEIREKNDQDVSDVIKFTANEDDNKSVKTSKSKFSSKIKLSRKDDKDKKPVVEFKTSPDQLEESIKLKSVVVPEDKKEEYTKPVVIFNSMKDDNDDNKSAKISLKSKKTTRSALKSKEPALSPEKAVAESTPNTLHPEFRVAANDDDDTKSKKSLKKKVNLKTPVLTNNSETAMLKDNEDDDKRSSKISLKSKKTSKNQPGIQPTLEKPLHRDSSQPAGPDDKALALLEKLRANRKPQEFKVEDDNFEGVIDKNQSIKILNASQGQSMLSRKSKANNVSDFNFKMEDSDEDRDNYF